MDMVLINLNNSPFELESGVLAESFTKLFELTEDEKIRAAIMNLLEKLGEGEKVNVESLSNLCEMMDSIMTTLPDSEVKNAMSGISSKITNLLGNNAPNLVKSNQEETAITKEIITKLKEAADIINKLNADKSNLFNKNATLLSKEKSIKDTIVKLEAELKKVREKQKTTQVELDGYVKAEKIKALEKKNSLVKHIVELYKFVGKEKSNKDFESYNEVQLLELKAALEAQKKNSMVPNRKTSKGSYTGLDKEERDKQSAQILFKL